MMHKINIRFEHDEDTENPFDNDGAWRMVCFSDRYRDAQSPDSEEFHTIGFRSKLNAGTAFILDCYEHSGVSWSLSGEGMNCMWDTSRSAGLLICDDKTSLGNRTAIQEMTYAERKASARLMLDVYNAWANGSNLYFDVSVCEVDGEEVEIDLDSCGGFIMCNNDEVEYILNDYIVPAITSYLEKSDDTEPEVVIIANNASDWGFDEDDIKRRVMKTLKKPELVAA